MDIEKELLREHSRRQVDRIARWIGNDQRRFRKLLNLFLGKEYRVTQRAAWVLSICADRHPALVRPHLRKMIAKMEKPDVHEAVRRNVVRILQEIDIPRGLLGRAATLCFGYLASGDASIAVKANSMTVLANIAAVEPDLGGELRLVIEQQLPYASAGFRARARKVLSALSQPQNLPSP